MIDDPAQPPISDMPAQLELATPDAGANPRAEQARKSQRMKALKSARIMVNSSSVGIDCVVRNLSPSGARLTFADPVDLPAHFTLYLPNENVRVGARLAWRKGLDAGVKFEKPLDWMSKHVAAKRF